VTSSATLGSLAESDHLAATSASLARLQKSERRRRLALTLPALAIIGTALGVPLAWLGFQSIVGPEGITAKYYTEIFRHAGYGTYLANTFKLSVLTTVICVLLAYPLSYALVTLRKPFAAFLFVCVISSFFASILVRTYAWLLVLQRRGVINSYLLEHGWIDRPLELVYNVQGTLVGMVNVLLPFMVLPLVNAMRRVDGSLVLAARGMGASRAQAFRDVFLPLSMPGLIAGGILTFVASLGFFLTPALLGGGRVVVWATAVASAAEENPEWGAGAALGIVMLVITFSVLFVLKHLFRVRGLLRAGR
jgi:putative spermidine/putrescine transport system permease protein